MDAQPQYSTQQKHRKYLPKNDLSFKSHSSSSFPTTYNNPNSFQNSLRPNNELGSTSADSNSYQNPNICYEKPTIKDNIVVLKKCSDFVSELFNAFGENNYLCNFSLFTRNVDIEIKLEEKIMKKITLLEYFESFIEGSFLCLNIPFLDKKGNISFNIFNPTLSSMNLIIHQNKIKHKINQKIPADNFIIDILNDDTVKIEFDEINPPYNRDIIENKIKIIHKILGTNNIPIKNIDKDKSYFSILWTPADTYKIKSSFLSVYTFDFKLIGTLIIKLDEPNWFMIFTNDANFTSHKKDFKSEYINNVNDVENFMKKCKGLNDEEKLNRKLFPQDYKRFIYNY